MTLKGKIYFIIVFMLGMLLACKEESPSGPVLVGEGYIIGTVFEEGTNNPIINASVLTDPPTSFVATNSAGMFKIANVDSGRYQVTATKNGFNEITVGVSLSHGDTAIANFILEPDVTIVNDDKGYIFGTVRDLDDNTTLQLVNISTVPITGSVLTDAEGDFFLTHLTPGVYKIIAKKQNYDSTSISVSVSAGDTTIADIFMSKKDTTVLETYGSLKGHILDAITGNEMQNVLVSTVPSSSVVNTDASGNFSIVDILPGTYKVKVSKVGYLSDSVSVLIQAGLITNSDFNLTPSVGSVAGRVTHAYNGLAINGALITTAPDGRTVTCDRDGYFNFNNITAQTYTFITTHASFKTDTTTVIVSPGITVTVGIVLEDL